MDNNYNFNQDPYNNNQNPFEGNQGGYDQYGNQGGYDQYGNQGGYGQGGYDQGGYDQGGYDPYGNQGGYDQGGYGQGDYNQGGYDQYGNQGGYNQGGYDQYGNPIQQGGPGGPGGPKKSKKKGLIVVGVLVILAIVIGFLFKDKITAMFGEPEEIVEHMESVEKVKDLPIIYGFDDNQRPVDKNGVIIKPVFDENGELLILPIDKDLLVRLGITEEEYSEGYFNPFFDEAGRSSKEPVLDLDNRPIMDSNGEPLLKIIGRDIIRDPAGDPFLKASGGVWYIDDPNAPSRESIERETGLKYDILSQREETNTINSMEVEEGDRSVLNLDESFFAKSADDSRIKESKWRDMGLDPQNSSTNYFIVYNYNGVLAPYDERGYNNREIYGRLLGFNFFREIMTHDIYELRPVYDMSRNQEPVIALESNYNKDQAIKNAKVLINELRQKNWYPDLSYKPVDRVVTDMIAFLDGQEYSKEKFATLYVPTVWYGIQSDEGTYARWLEVQIDEGLKTLHKTNSKTMNRDQLSRLHYDIYLKILDNRINYYKDAACKEMNKQSANSCPNYKDLSTLEIRSDFIESSYKYAYEKSFKDYAKVVYAIHSEVRNPASQYNLVEDEIKQVEEGN